MAELLTDSDIQRLLDEPKLPPANYQELMRLKPKRGHKEAELAVQGAEGSLFRLILRQNDIDPFDFSVIIGYEIPKTNVVFRLRRYNGKSHWHTNKLERLTFFDYHIHQATHRYQEAGLKEDAFAEPTVRYVDLDGAIECAIQDCRFHLPHKSQLFLPFAGGEA